MDRDSDTEIADMVRGGWGRGGGESGACGTGGCGRWGRGWGGGAGRELAKLNFKTDKKNPEY